MTPETACDAEIYCGCSQQQLQLWPAAGMLFLNAGFEQCYATLHPGLANIHLVSVC